MVKRLIREGVVIELPFTVWIDEEGIDRIPEVGMRNWEYLKRIMGAITEKLKEEQKEMTETEKRLRREIVRLEAEKEELIRRLQKCETLNYQRFEEIKSLNYYIRAMEAIE